MKLIEALVAPERLGDVKEALSRVEVFRLTVSEVTGLERPPRSSSALPAGTGTASALPAGAASAASAAGAAGAAGAGSGASRGSAGAGAFEPRPRVRLEIAVNEAFVVPTVEAIRSACGGPSGGGGRIWIHPLKDAIRVRTGERGPEAI
jgi:nitrogen regulatory protein P-II 2